MQRIAAVPVVQDWDHGGHDPSPRRQNGRIYSDIMGCQLNTCKHFDGKVVVECTCTHGHPCTHTREYFFFFFFN